MKGEGNQQDYGMRIYDPRLGRFLSVDPLTQEYPWNSTYAFAEDGPIANVDLDGGERKQSVSDLKAFVPTLVPATENATRQLAQKAATEAAKNGGSKIVEKLGEKWFLKGLRLGAKGGSFFITFMLNGLAADGGAGSWEQNQKDKYNPQKTSSTDFEPSPRPELKLAPNSPGKKVDEDDDEDDDQFVYRRGGYTDNTFTPSPGKDDDLTNPKYGMSVDASPAPGSTSQKISVKKLFKNGFGLSYYKGHISIIPIAGNVEKNLKNWASMKGKLPEGALHHPNSHRLTKALHRARVGAVKQPK